MPDPTQESAPTPTPSPPVEPDLIQTVGKAADWRENAACKGHMEAFFPTDWKGPWVYDVARLMCRACPVLNDCKKWAMSVEIEAGFIAGMTPKERQEARCAA